ncbi:hypothetical protein BP6252_10365 [Coleophoma cylindrospora]|uniref:Uncharacterized protein n=1 Tax=Coleophoma cylindrospora TaxID=1849047 RepID=A0A3D8QT74_9HELO|nr:hypothetical protein BP6252_10365 [Coleophoma cylindrospora]
MSAAIPTALTQQRRSSSSTRTGGISHGRGGAGNMGHTAADSELPELSTPTLKSDMYTTGRGGSGNMAKNTDPVEARRAQDVEAVMRRDDGGEVRSVGRGGVANVWKGSEEERKREGSSEREKGLAELGKEWLMGKNKGKA